ncbi:peptidyl-prolyl cis-trans isomerase [Cutibacterium acnes JCM 18916]|nr:peptidyl-prolyl cis-trans isomerase [Cutibacterium acnes JCM 18916]
MVPNGGWRNNSDRFDATVSILEGTTSFLTGRQAGGLYRDSAHQSCDIVLNLFADQAPKTVDNFVGLAGGTKEYVDPHTGQPTTGKFYDGLTFHRVIDGS